MKILSLILALSAAAVAQPAAYVGAGLGYNQYATPAVNGVAVYAHRLTANDKPTYSFTAISFISNRTKPFTVSTVTETGVAQYIQTFGPFAIYGLAMAGVATSAVSNGTNVGLAYSGGGLAQASIGRGWAIGPFVRVLKPGTVDRQIACGILLGFGK